MHISLWIHSVSLESQHLTLVFEIPNTLNPTIEVLKTTTFSVLPAGGKIDSSPFS